MFVRIREVEVIGLIMLGRPTNHRLIMIISMAPRSLNGILDK